MTVSVLDHTCLGSGKMSIGRCLQTKPYTECALMDNWGAENRVCSSTVGVITVELTKAKRRKS
eukprot:4668624-Pyramimonas_sp.AAC.2